MESLFAKYGYAPDKERIAKRLDAVAANIDNVTSSEVLKNCMSLMDLTTLRTEDTTESVKKLVEKVNAFMADYPEYPLPASICVYPNFASVVRENLAGKDVRVTAVAGCFPTSQSFVEVKVKECEMAVEAGADEIDIVLALNAFMAGDDDAARAEIRAIRAAIDETASRLGRTVTLKVILETGLLVTPENIAKASLLAMEEGADFIKTSTGFSKAGATFEDIALFAANVGPDVQMKAAGGISSFADAEEFVRLGATRLGTSRLVKLAKAEEQQ